MHFSRIFRRAKQFFTVNNLIADNAQSFADVLDMPHLGKNSSSIIYIELILKY